MAIFNSYVKLPEGNYCTSTLLPGYTCSMSSFSVLELRWLRFQDTLGDEGGELMVNSYHHQATLTRVPRSPMYHDFKDGTSCWDQLVNSCKLTHTHTLSLSLCLKRDSMEWIHIQFQSSVARKDQYCNLVTMWACSPSSCLSFLKAPLTVPHLTTT